VTSAWLAVALTSGGWHEAFLVVARPSSFFLLVALMFVTPTFCCLPAHPAQEEKWRR